MDIDVATKIVTKQNMLELFSWKATFHKDHLEVRLPIRRLISGLYGMLWPSMKLLSVR